MRLLLSVVTCAVILCFGVLDQANAECTNDPKYDSDCVKWAGEGECGGNEFWMPFHCQKACSTCSLCIDDSRYADKCPEWKTEGECDTNTDWMPYHCMKTCGKCSDSTSESTQAPPDFIQGCQDNPKYAEKCPKWAKYFQCQQGPDFMRAMCPKSCKVC